MKYPILFALAVTLTFATIAPAQKLWEKPAEKWSKEDVLKIISDSPWARTHQATDAQARASMTDLAANSRDSVNRGGNGSNAGSRGRDAGPAPVVIRLHSGLPIRQAINRARQIGNNYDKMSPEQKAEYDKGAKGYLDCAVCHDYYVISITKFTDSTGQGIDEAVFQRSTLEELKGNVWLSNDKGERRELFQFTAPKKAGDSAYFFFPRNDAAGHPLISAEDKSFTLSFGNNFFAGSNPYAAFVPRSAEFSVSKIIVGERVEF